MSLFFQELRKIGKQKVYLVVSAVLLLVNGGYIFYNYRLDADDSKAYWEIYDVIEGPMSDGNIAFVVQSRSELESLVSRGNNEYSEDYYSGYPVGDLTAFQFHIDEMERVFLYNAFIQEIRADALDNVEFYESIHQDYQARINQRIYQTYTTRAIHSYYDMNGFYQLFSYDFSSILLLMVLWLIVSLSFVSEKERQMDQIILTSKHGWKKTVSAKRNAAMAVVVMGCVLFAIVDIIVFLSVNKLHGWNAPIYQIQAFGLSPLTVSVWQYLLFGCFCKVFGFSIMCLWMQNISALFNEAMSPMVLNFLLMGALLYGYHQDFLSVLNPVSLLAHRDLVKIAGYTNLWGYPVSNIGVTFAANGALLIALAVSLRVVYSRQYVINAKFLSKAKKRLSGLGR